MQFSKFISSESKNLSISDRIDSLKAGCLGAIASVFAFFVIALCHHFLQNHLTNVQLISNFELDIALMLLIKLAMIGFAGFLFAVTYRYIVRRDRNSHLKSGAILAFACIRSVTTIDHELTSLIQLPLISMALAIIILLVENIVWLAIIQSLIETAIQHKWITTFGYD
ncbi:MAG TPA: hypothetical protein DCZ88_14970 [Pseudanabaena sp.]|nr:hypothetical protein [Pseudanabaena sp.]